MASPYAYRAWFKAESDFQAIWQPVFQETTVPILSGRTEEFMHPAFGRAPFYRMDQTRLTEEQRERLVVKLALEMGCTLLDARYVMRQGLNILLPAQDVDYLLEIPSEKEKAAC